MSGALERSSCFRSTALQQVPIVVATISVPLSWPGSTHNALRDRAQPGMRGLDVHTSKWKPDPDAPRRSGGRQDAGEVVTGTSELNGQSKQWQYRRSNHLERKMPIVIQPSESRGWMGERRKPAASGPRCSNVRTGSSGFSAGSEQHDQRRCVRWTDAPGAQPGSS